MLNRDIAPSVKLTLEELERAAANEYSVEIDYRTSYDEQLRSRVVDPYGMLYSPILRRGYSSNRAAELKEKACFSCNGINGILSVVIASLTVVVSEAVLL